MSESLPSTHSKQDGSGKSLDSNGDLATPRTLTKVYDSSAADLEKEREQMRIANTTETMRQRVFDSQPQQLSF